MMKMQQYKINSIITHKLSRFHLEITNVIIKTNRINRMKNTDKDEYMLKNIFKEKDLKRI